jgi:hypothetical protein
MLCLVTYRTLSPFNVLIYDRAREREQHEVWASGRGKIRYGEYCGKLKKRKRRMNEVSKELKKKSQETRKETYPKKRINAFREQSVELINVNRSAT